MIGCLRTRVRKQPIITLYFETEIVLQFYNLEARTKLRVCIRKIIFLFFNQNICCGYSKEPSQLDGSFEHPKHMLKLWVRKDLQFYPENLCLSKHMFDTAHFKQTNEQTNKQTNKQTNLNNIHYLQQEKPF